MLGRLRWILAAAGLAAAGAAAARGAARRAVAQRKDALLAAAEVEARRRLRAEGLAFERRTLRRFMLSSAVKLSVLAALAGLSAWGVSTGQTATLLIAAALTIFLARDLWVIWPTARLCLAALARQGWRPKAALGAVAASEAMAAALEAAKAAPVSWRERIALAAAGVDRDAFSQELALSVAALARQAAWPELRPIARAAALKFALGFAVYTAFAAALIWSAT
ncbi:MAG: hypothetical protein AAGM38_12115 [Pseudomonadota bacterium]